jgi:hypothetical protein
MIPSKLHLSLDVLDEEAEPTGGESPLCLHINKNGVRAILGAESDDIAPDLLIERRPACWRVILHPGDGDAVGALYMGPGFVVITDAECPTRILETFGDVPEAIRQAIIKEGEP